MIKTKLARLIEEFEQKFFERNELIRVMLLAAFSKEHIFLIGKPGVGKTAIARRISNAFGSRHWEILMAYDTEAEQLIGSLKEDEHGRRYRDLSEGMLDKEFPFLDEMFKGRNKVLNALLGPMLDRVYADGNNFIDVPLITLFAASNEFPQGEEIKPFDDRLLFRYEVKRMVDEENRKKYARGDFDKSPIFSDPFTVEDIHNIVDQAQQVNFSDEMNKVFITLQDAIIRDGIEISDRKFGLATKVFRVSACINGRQEIDVSDLMLLLHMAWHNYTDRRKLHEVLYKAVFGCPVRNEADLYKDIEAFEKIFGQLEADYGNVLRNNEINGLTPENFAIMRHGIIQYLTNLERHYQGIVKLNESYRKALNIEQACSKNIFLYDIHQTSFTQSIIEEIQANKKSMEKILETLRNWLNSNIDLFSYNRQRYER